MEEKEVENRSIRCVGCLYWDWNRYHWSTRQVCRALAAARHPLLTGMCGTDLWWGGMRAWGEKGAVAVAYALDGVDVATELVSPGAVSVFEIVNGTRHAL